MDSLNLSLYFTTIQCSKVKIHVSLFFTSRCIYIIPISIYLGYVHLYKANALLQMQMQILMQHSSSLLQSSENFSWDHHWFITIQIRYMKAKRLNIWQNIQLVPVLIGMFSLPKQAVQFFKTLSRTPPPYHPSAVQN